MNTTQNTSRTSSTIATDEAAVELDKMQASTTDSFPFAVWLDAKMTTVKFRANAAKLIASDLTLPTFASISFAPRA